MDEEYKRGRRKRALREVPEEELAQFFRDNVPAAPLNLHEPGGPRDYLPALGGEWTSVDIDLTALFGTEFPGSVQVILNDVYGRGMRLTVEQTQPEWKLLAVLFYDGRTWSVKAGNGDLLVTGMALLGSAKELLRSHYGW